MISFPPKELDAEERALTDGRIGPGNVGIDRASLCGSMTIKDGMEVWQTFICKYVLLKSPVVNYKDTLKCNPDQLLTKLYCCLD